MNIKEFTDAAAGRCIRTPRDYWAYVPNPLPPELTWDARLAQGLTDASLALGELSGAGRLLPNPHLLMASYIKREAVLSSRIENTQAGLSDLFFFEAENEESPVIPDVQEVAQYVKAMNYGLARLRDLPISSRLIREIHNVLMSGVRDGHLTPGEFRTSQNWIGPPGCTLNEATYVPPPVDEMNEALSAWERYVNAQDAREPNLIQCALMHYQFEAIHPFLDGNGRVGRLLITFFLCERCCLSKPLLYLSAYFEQHRDEYYKRLLEVSRSGDWGGWLNFFLRGITTQARDALENANRILELHASYRAQLSGKRVPRAAGLLVDHLFQNPVLSLAKTAKELDLTFPTLKRGVDELQKQGILKEITGKKRNRLFVAHKLMRLLLPPGDRAGTWGSPRRERGTV
ncbi:MAG: toxin Fic [Planctomycetota bacterium]